MNGLILTRDMCEEVRVWRNKVMETLRTPHVLTGEMQDRFYAEIVCNPLSPHRYFGFAENNLLLLGMGGITNIQWENGIGEISLIVNPDFRGKGHGKTMAYSLYDYAFNTLRLHTVCGECYNTNPNGVKFWRSLFPDMSIAVLPNRKFWEGKYFDSVYFSISEEAYRLWQQR